MTSTDGRWRTAGLALGLLAVVIGAHGPIGAAPRPFGTAFHMAASPTGELGVAPSGSFLTATDLRPGEHAVGRVSVRNQTAAALTVTAQAMASGAGDNRVHVRVVAGDVVVAEGTLSDWVAGSRPWPLGSGQETDLAVEAWTVATDSPAPELVDVEVRFETRQEGL